MISEAPVRVPIIKPKDLPRWPEATRFNEEYLRVQRDLSDRYPKTQKGDLKVPVADLAIAFKNLGQTLDQRLVVPKVEMGQVWKTDNQSDIKAALSANTAKLLQEPARLMRIYTGETPSPMTVHLTMTEVCNLICKDCCCANRKVKEVLRPDQAVKALVGYALLTTQQVEFTGGGEPTTAPYLPYAILLARALGYEKLGLITNGTLIERMPPMWSFLDWVRVSIYNHETGRFPNIDIIRDAGTSVGFGYVYDLTNQSQNPNMVGGWDDENRKLSPQDKRQTMETFLEMLDWVDKVKVPGRIVPNAIRARELVEHDAQEIQQILDKRHQGQRLLAITEGRDPDEVARYAFVADVNNKVRANNDCYMAMLKPSVTTANILGEGKVVVCPCYVYAPENEFGKRNQAFVVTKVDDILPYYQEGPKRRQQTCSACQFADQISVIGTMLTPTEQPRPESKRISP